MVFDMTDNESRTSLRAVEDWSNQLHRYVSKDVPIILAGNKVWIIELDYRDFLGEHLEFPLSWIFFASGQ